MLSIEDVDVPYELLQSGTPVIVLRFQLACLTQRGCLLMQSACLNPTGLTDNVQQLHKYQPGTDIPAKSNEGSSILLLHLDYYGLLLAILTVMETTARLFPRFANTNEDSSIKIPNHAMNRMDHARRMLRLVGDIAATATYLSQTLCW